LAGEKYFHEIAGHEQVECIGRGLDFRAVGRGEGGGGGNAALYVIAGDDALRDFGQGKTGQGAAHVPAAVAHLKTARAGWAPSRARDDAKLSREATACASCQLETPTPMPPG